MRSYPAKYGFFLNEFDPYFDYRATKYIVDHGLDAYWKWHDTMSWYPEGRDIPGTSQSALHITAAYMYKIFGGGSSLLDFTILFPAIIGSLTVIVIFALVRVLGGTSAGLFSALLFAFSPAIIQRGNLGWFKSEPLGLFFGLLAMYLFISAMRHKEIKYALPKAIAGGLILGLANGAWGGSQYFSIPVALFFIALPFFRKDLTIPMYVAIAFTVFTLVSATAFPRPGISFTFGLPGIAMMGGTIFLVGAFFLRRIGKSQQQLRNTVFLLIAFIAIAVGFIVAGPYVSPSFRYIKSINPFASQANPLVQSVAEHFTPSIVDYFTDFSILLMFAGVGIWLAFRRRDDISIFALLIGLSGVWVSATFARLLVFASIGIIVLTGLGLFEVTRSVMAYREASVTQSHTTTRSMVAATREERRKQEFAGRGQSTASKAARIGYVVVLIMMLSIPMFYPANSNWISSADVPAAIANGGTGFRLQTNDWIDAMNWISKNTDPNAVIASWWDYGYWITALSNRTTLADNGTLNSTRIATIAKMLISPEQSGIKIAKDLKADYILVYAVGQIRFFGTANSTGAAGNTTGSERIPLYVLGGGGDESKKQWFMRIGGFDESKFIEPDGVTPTPAFWNSTLLGKLFPFDPSAYVSFGQGGSIQNIQPKWQQGLTALYTKHIKYPTTSDPNQPLQLVYSSPSFKNNENPMFGVLIYKVNHDYVPQVQSNSSGSQARPTSASTNQTTSTPAANLLTIPAPQKAVVQTTQGTMEIEFYPNAAPKHVKNFIDLANTGFYNGTIFHRIIPGFVIQGGDPNTKVNGTDRSKWGLGGPNSTVPAEFNDIPHTRGIVSMARSQDPNSAGSQFFIVLDNNTSTSALDHQYTVFGKVTNGMDVVDKIAALPTFKDGANLDQPMNPNDARIISIKIVEK
jgi:dolichyl-diphosphooligosaccharide--protein glycosyltransferase